MEAAVAAAFKMGGAFKWTEDVVEENLPFEFRLNIDEYGGRLALLFSFLASKLERVGLRRIQTRGQRDANEQACPLLGGHATSSDSKLLDSGMLSANPTTTTFTSDHSCHTSL